MKESHLEVKVGFFVLAGLAAMAMLIVAFGKFGNYLKKPTRSSWSFRTHGIF